jgi:molecular chaperone GrpE
MLKNKKNNINNSKDMKDTENAMKTNDSSTEGVQESLNGKDAASADVKETVQAEKLSDKKEIESELEKKIKEIETLTDTMKRRQADFENYKKRMIKMQEEQKKFAIRDFALDVIDINDDLLRAYGAACNINRDKSVNEICNTFSEGYIMLSKRIEEALHKYGIDEIDSLDKEFDPTCNEAIEIDESENFQNDTVTKVHQKGFRLDDLVIRAARVKVTKPKKAAKNADCGNGSNNPEQENNISANSEE